MSARVTVVEKDGARPLSKRVFLDASGELRADGSPCAMAGGVARRVELDGRPAERLAGLIGGLSSHRALILGDLRPDLPDAVRLDVKRRADPAKGTSARSRENFDYRAGEPAFALLDHGPAWSGRRR